VDTIVGTPSETPTTIWRLGGIFSTEGVLMAKLTFRRSASVMVLTSRGHEMLGVWRAHNRVASGHQVWPIGTWPYAGYNAHPLLSEPSTVRDCWSGSGIPKGEDPGIGCFGIHIFDVTDPNGTTIDGLGVHAGRTEAPPGGSLYSLGGKTLGCIRVPPAADDFNQSRPFRWGCNY